MSVPHGRTGDKFTSQTYFGWKRSPDLLYAHAHLFSPLSVTPFSQELALCLHGSSRWFFSGIIPAMHQLIIFPSCTLLHLLMMGEIWLLALELCISMKRLSGAEALPTQYRSPHRPHPSREQGTKLNFLSNSGASFLSRQQTGDTPSWCQGLSLLTPFTPGAIEEKPRAKSRLSVDIYMKLETVITIILIHLDIYWIWG